MSAERAKALIDSLGDSSDAIADALASVGCVGHPLVARACPLFRYLTDLGVDPVAVSARAVLLRDGGVVLLSPAQTAFVRKFDAGRFPFLDSTPHGLGGRP